MKICTICNVEKPLIEFYKDLKNKDGRNSNCKECTKKQTLLRYQKIKEDPIAYKLHLEKSAEYKRQRYLRQCLNRNKDDYENM